MNNIISIGNFDGIHRGHRKLIHHMLELARQRSLRTVILTYDQHPAYTLNAAAKPLLLLPVPQKKQRLLELGIDQVELLRFDEDFAHISAADFLHSHLMPNYSPSVIVVGYDSHFGFQRQGDLSFLSTHAAQYGFELHYVEACLDNGTPISSSQIRQLLLQGDVVSANQLLGTAYTLFGNVIPGKGLGQKLGFPTANLCICDPHQLIPAPGVYLSRVRWGESSFFGLTNIGTNPTVKSGDKIGVETHILDFDQTIYNEYLELELLRFLREERMFSDTDTLIRAMQRDLRQAKTLLAQGVS